MADSAPKLTEKMTPILTPSNLSPTMEVQFAVLKGSNWTQKLRRHHFGSQIWLILHRHFLTPVQLDPQFFGEDTTNFKPDMAGFAPPAKRNPYILGDTAARAYVLQARAGANSRTGTLLYCYFKKVLR